MVRAAASASTSKAKAAKRATNRIPPAGPSTPAHKLAAMMTPQQQRTIVTALAVILGIALVLSLVGPFLAR